MNRSNTYLFQKPSQVSTKLANWCFSWTSKSGLFSDPIRTTTKIRSFELNIQKPIRCMFILYRTRHWRFLYSNIRVTLWRSIFSWYDSLYIAFPCEGLRLAKFHTSFEQLFLAVSTAGRLAVFNLLYTVRNNSNIFPDIVSALKCCGPESLQLFDELEKYFVKHFKLHHR